MKRKLPTRLWTLVLAMGLAAGPAAAETFTYRDLTFPNGIPGRMRAEVEQRGERYDVTCSYEVEQEENMGLENMPLGSAHVRGVETADRATVRRLCLDHFEDTLDAHYE